jgi:hypothetical protein
MSLADHLPTMASAVHQNFDHHFTDDPSRPDALPAGRLGYQRVAELLADGTRNSRGRVLANFALEKFI